MNAVSFFYQAGVSFLIFGLLSRWYVWPFIQRLDRKTALTLLLLPSLLRQVGETHLARTAIPDPVPGPLAWGISLGDFACLASALLAIICLRSYPRMAIPMVWIGSIIGVIDYVGIAAWSARERAYDHLGAHWYVGCYYVPLLGVLQIVVLMTLLKRDWPGDARQPGRTAGAVT
jgi:hypothetical protein